MGHITHGLYHHELYPIWQSMKQRCLNEHHPAYYRYGGRGIRICKRWIESFPNFVRDMGARPRGFTLERKHNNRGYTPSNCIWADRSTQARNRAGRGQHLPAAERKKLIENDSARLAAHRELARIKPKPCEKCGNMFVHHGGHQEQMYCSMACFHQSRREHNAKQFTKVCKFCFVSFIPKRRKRTATFCSIACAAKHREANR